MKYLLLLGMMFSTCLLSAQQVEIDIDLFADGFSQPVDMKHVGDDRLFVVEKTGQIKILNSNGTTNGTPFLDLSGDVSNGGEQGLLSVAFHPDYDKNGFFFVNYTKLDGDTRVSRFKVSDGDPNVADPASELIIIEYDQPFANHNGGCIQFGPDGYLYIASGDGGSGGDPGNRAQNTSLVLGKLLRLDVDNPDGGNNYGIPNDNPFAGSDTDAQEIWAYGLRNPWKFAFDVTAGDLWIADVGQNAVEEVNKVDWTLAGLNYGWRCYEGSEEFNTGGCPDPSELTFPITEYEHSGGTSNSIVGGYVYRGTDNPDLQGFYFYADTYRNFIGVVDPNEDNEIYTGFSGTWVSFGEDSEGELYIISIGGDIYKLTAQVLGINDPNQGTIAVYPNPTMNLLTVRADNDSIEQIELMDVNGRLIRTLNGNSSDQVQLQLADLTAGVYFIRAFLGSGQQISQQIVRR
ncbi:PQQ-dependent sugar dehydrogenase [Aureitalea marina]|uniref:Cadherin n=1 Tax=Aureitalea marina TaxID=930804 RepID=A0A2S7KN27_9FLAO|nr:PQQ-dependent sugar dehydrogenase [Aureitalea marina]PQB04011.1 hypothetical protein BST85_03160 [Aureitalea marina]